MEPPATGPTAGPTACPDTEKLLPEPLIAPFRQKPRQRERSRLGLESSHERIRRRIRGTRPRLTRARKLLILSNKRTTTAPAHTKDECQRRRSWRSGRGGRAPGRSAGCVWCRGIRWWAPRARLSGCRRRSCLVRGARRGRRAAAGLRWARRDRRPAWPGRAGLCCGMPVPKARRQHHDSALPAMPAWVLPVRREGTAFWLTGEEAEMCLGRGN